LFAGAVLKVLDANNTRFGLSMPAIRLLVRQFGFNRSETETTDALEYLAGKGLVEETPKVLVKVNRAWKITDAGREYLDERNL
jgi:DNA-binding FadR family transcriptional regulator